DRLNRIVEQVHQTDSKKNRIHGMAVLGLCFDRARGWLACCGNRLHADFSSLVIYPNPASSGLWELYRLRLVCRGSLSVKLAQGFAHADGSADRQIGPGMKRSVFRKQDNRGTEFKIGQL